MLGLHTLLEKCKRLIRGFMRHVAAGLNRVSQGRLSPNIVTIVGFVMHVPIAILIAREQFGWAALLLIIFGLFDTLDGELARLQGQVSRLGMLLDSATDRAKEVILYSGIAYYLVESAASNHKPLGYYAALAVMACGGSLLVSYMNAWGEVVMNQSQRTDHAVNQTFRTGLMGFEMRMFLLIIGLMFHWLVVIIVLITVLAWVTALNRLLTINHQLQ